jgi:hypothetical protein
VTSGDIYFSLARLVSSIRYRGPTPTMGEGISAFTRDTVKLAQTA